ncbi:MAG: hypothetical protein AAF543_01960 [Pseudomonadota bacterium]
MSESEHKILPMKPTGERLRSAFLGWQCRLRQLAVREGEARPTSGMRPSLSVAGQEAGAITVVLVPSAPAISTREFRHIVRRTHDPRERYQAAIRYLQSSHFQDPSAFDDRLTALFAADAELPKLLSGRRDCILAFEQFSQRYRLPCQAERLDVDDEAFQATYWHNALFNPSLPASVDVLAFRADWSRAEADPSPV